MMYFITKKLLPIMVHGLTESDSDFKKQITLIITSLFSVLTMMQHGRLNLLNYLNYG